MPVVQEKNDVEKSAAIDSTNKISVTVINQNGDEVYFKISKFTQLKKLMHSYCERGSMNIDSVAFLFDDCFLQREHTPIEVGMDDGDKIYAFYAKSLRRNKKGRPSLTVEKGSRPQSQMETEQHRDNGHREKENYDAYTFDELAKRTTHSFEQAMSFLKASFDKSNRLTEEAHKYMEEVQTKTKSLKRDFDAKLVAEKKVSEKDLMIKQMHNELQKANDVISNLSKEEARLTAELLKVKKELVKPDETVQSIRKERGDSKRASMSGSQNQRKRSRLHDPVTVQQQGNVKDVEESRISVEDEDKKSDDGSPKIHIRVKGLSGEAVFFKIRRTALLGKVMRAYCDRQGEKDYDALCFVIHGKIQKEDTTPYELQMKDGDVIYAMPKSKDLCLPN